MKELMGSIFSGLIIDENDKAYFVQKEGITFRLDKEEGEHKLGEAVEGFAYQNQNQDWRITTILPESRKGQYGIGEVTDSRRDLGVFVNIGLKDKDVAVSLDELPLMRELWPKKGDKLMIALKADDKDRLWGTIADEKFFQAMGRAGDETFLNKDIKGMVYRLKMVGTFIITADNYLGFIHPSERYQEPRLGEEVSGRVIGVRPDGVLNISLKPRAHEAIGDDASMVLAFLTRAPENQMNYTDKSNPEEIQKMFGISKGQFKRALGNLMKQRLIEQKDGITRLTKKPEESVD
ncbi:S1 RNA-binding domain-containing protein [Enterococcus alcedinis]|uniref:S1 RNA-binding protein n=1 Tax=Enterococcus alcedinis TaxID=1274384 RepID=A0A917JJ05_9ENTE|nr:S1-like domain-containing RNA-binding protein [Enterococcus alcedinis]MBP2103186.1 putative RNA-binding protein (virulence factor B family) [Enterococcus alcedinis]GGI66750.1 S1 RNA-binding protein [Enterococcus alcedinis]